MNVRVGSAVSGLGGSVIFAARSAERPVQNHFAGNANTR